jgi:hypothetical protein
MSFLTPEHNAEVSSLIEEMSTSGATEQEVDQAVQSYMQNRAITDRNYGEMKKPSDAPYSKGGVGGAVVGGVKQLWDMASSPVRSFIDDAKTHPGRTALETVAPPLRGNRQLLEFLARSGGQVAERGGEAIDAARAGDPALASARGVQAAASVIPGMGGTIEHGNEFSRTGATEQMGRVVTDLAAATAPVWGPPVGRAIKPLGDRIGASVFAPTNPAEMALADQAGASIASGSPVGSSGLNRSLLTKEAEAASRSAAADAAVRALEDRLRSPTMGNRVGTRKIIDDVKSQLRTEAGRVPGNKPGTEITANPQLGEALDNMVTELEGLSQSGGRSLRDILDYRRRLPEAPATGEAARGIDLATDAITREVQRVVPEHKALSDAAGSARTAAAEAKAIRELPRAEPSSVYKSGGRAAAAAGVGFGAAGVKGAAAAAAMSALRDILATPAAKTMSAVTMNRLGTLLQRGDVTGALALAQAATQQENQ